MRTFGLRGHMTKEVRMINLNKASLNVLGLILLGVAGAAMSPWCQADSKEPEVPAVKKVDDQYKALDEATRVDLPALKQATKVVVEEAAPPVGKGRRVVLGKPEEIREIREFLKPSNTPPSAGMTAATLTFYRDEKPLRKVWVFERGEWGFERPGTSHTTGIEANLWRVIQRHMK